jgi:hypothetical protein
MATTITKLFSTGILQSSVAFDEVTYSSVKVGPAGVYAAQFDEVTQSPIKNLLTYSNQMQAGGWTRSGTLADNADIAPDGTNTALLETQVTGGDNLIYSNGVPGNTSTTYTASVYFKQGTKPTVGLYVDDAGFGGARWLSVYTWASGTLTNSIGGLNGGAGATLPTSTVSPAPNGWIRMTMTFRPIDVGNMILMVNRDLQPTGGTTYIWGAQLEANTSVTPYQGIGASGVIVTPDYAERRTSTGTYMVSGYFDEYTLYNPSGQQEFTTPGTYSWTAPAGVTSVSVVAIGPGATNGGGGGGLTWANGLGVTPGQSYTVVVGAGGFTSGVPGTFYSSFNGTACVGNGGTSGGGTGGLGGRALDVSGATTFGGGNGGTWGGGAGGYAGNGGVGYGNNNTTNPGANGSGGGGGGGGNQAFPNNGGGGGTGIYGQGTDGVYPGGGGSGGGTSSAGGTSSVSGLYGGGGVLGGTSKGGNGAVRIIWGAGRSFPSTNTADV